MHAHVATIDIVRLCTEDCVRLGTKSRVDTIDNDNNVVTVS